MRSWALALFVGALFSAVLVPQASAGVPLGTSVRVEYTDSKFSDPVYQSSDGAPDVRNYGRAAEYHALVRDRYSSVTPENELQFWSVWPTPDGQPNFGPADRVIGWARSIDKQIRGHALIFGDAVPAWLANGRFTSRQLGSILRRHITTTMRRYRGVIREWDVVNEPILANGLFRPPLLPGLPLTEARESVWARTYARMPRTMVRRRVPRYIYEAFRVARRADPTASLCINEINAEGINARSNRLYELVRALRSARLIDCVGFQGHFGPGNPPPPAGELEQNLARFAALGVKVQFTEMDLPILGARQGNTSLGYYDAERRWQQQVYEMVASVCAAQPACTRFTVWGASDANSWRGASTEPLLVGSDMRPKPVYSTVAHRLAAAAR